MYLSEGIFYYSLATIIRATCIYFKGDLQLFL